MLTLQIPQNVWGYPPSMPPGVILSRQVHGQWMDLFAVHQVLFPLIPGLLVIPPGSVEYAVPVNFSFFSTEERYNLTTDGYEPSRGGFVVSLDPPTVSKLRCEPAVRRLEENTAVGDGVTAVEP